MHTGDCMKMKAGKEGKRRGQVEALSDFIALSLTFLVIVIFLAIFIFVKASYNHKIEASSQKLNFRISLLSFLSMDADGKSVAERITDWDAGINRKENMEEVMRAYNYLNAFFSGYKNCFFKFSITQNGVDVKHETTIRGKYPLTPYYEAEIPLPSLNGNKLAATLLVIGINGKTSGGRGCVR